MLGRYSARTLGELLTRLSKAPKKGAPAGCFTTKSNSMLEVLAT